MTGIEITMPTILKVFFIFYAFDGARQRLLTVYDELLVYKFRQKAVIP